VRVVLDHDTRRLREQLACLIRADLLGRLDEHRLAVSDRHWDADAGRGDAQLRIVKDLARLVDDLDFLFVVAARFGAPPAGTTL